MHKRYVSPNVPSVSSCGTRINYNISDGICLAHVQTAPRSFRIISQQQPLKYKHECYELERRQGLLEIVFSRTRPLSSLEFSQTRVTSKPLTSYPSYLEGAEVTILLGSTDHDLMCLVTFSKGRLLEMKTLLFTFAEVRSWLIEMWDQTNKPDEGNACMNKKGVLNEDKPNTSNSEVQSPCDLITWFQRE